MTMRILFIVPYAPTPIRTRPYNLLRELARRGHEVILATLWQNAEERAALQEWERSGVRVTAAPLTAARALWNSLSALPTSAPVQAVYCWQPALMRSIQKALGDQAFDVVHVEHLRGARYGVGIRNPGSGIRGSQFMSHGAHEQGAESREGERGMRYPASRAPDGGPRIPIVWDSVDCISHLFAQASRVSASSASRLITRLELSCTRRYEAWLARQFDQVLVTSPVDKEAFERLDKEVFKDSTARHGNAIGVLSNGVDLQHFQPGVWPRLPDTIVFSGKMSYHANETAALYFAREVLPLIWEKRPAARFTIAGYNPPAKIRALAQDARVIVTGSVPDVAPYLRRSAVAVAPMPYGAGIQNKVLEAMACGTPVVATRHAVSALQAIPGEHLLVGGDAPDLASRIVALLDDPDSQKRIGQAGRRYVEDRHDWRIITGSLEAIYAGLIERGGGDSHG